MIKSLILYFQFFTRLPIPVPIEDAENRFKKGIIWFSVFGLVIGLIEAAFLWIFYWLLQSFLLAWIGVLLFDVMLTGAFHMDALADMCDGLFSSRKKERMLEIMKDSRVGSNGVLALTFYYILLIAPISVDQTDLDISFLMRLIVSLQIIGKSGIALLFWKMTYAGHTKGLGRLFLNVASWRIIFAELICFSMLYSLLGWQACLAYLVVIFIHFGYRRLVYKKIDGMNGDTLGAFHCIAQIVFLLTFLRLK